MSTLQVGIVGAGGIAKSHLKVCLPDLGVKAVAIADIHEAAAKERAEEFNVPNVYTDYRDLINDPDVEAVIVATPNFLHADVSIEALEKGKHVLCEKPMAVTVDEAKKMVETARAREKVLMVGMNNRFHPHVRYVKKLIDDGQFGRIHWVRVGWLRQSGIPGWGSWFTRKDMAGGGALIDIGVHMLDVGWYLMGSPKPQSVSAAVNAISGPKKKGLGGWGQTVETGYFDVDDQASAAFRFEDGQWLTMDVSWAVHNPGGKWVHVIGDKGGATLLDGSLTVTLEKDGESVTTEPEVAWYDIRTDMITHFVQCCHTGGQPLSSGYDGYDVVRMLNGIYESSDARREVVF